MSEESPVETPGALVKCSSTLIEALDAIIDKRGFRHRFNLLPAGEDYSFIEHQVHNENQRPQTTVLYLGQKDVRQSFTMLKYWPEANKASEVHFYNETLAKRR
jgi:hypothetical protein